MFAVSTDQAAALRRLRKPAYQLVKDVEHLIGVVAEVRCPHEATGEEHDPKHCHYCRVFSAATAAHEALENLTDAIDQTLIRSKHPDKEKKGKAS